MIADIYLDTGFSIPIKNITKVKRLLTGVSTTEYVPDTFSDLVLDDDCIYSFIGERNNTFVVKGCHIIYVDFHA